MRKEKNRSFFVFVIDLFTFVDYHKENYLCLLYEVIPISYVKNARSCVACGKEFEEQDDVVFCPECGAPHHRECWKDQGHCHYEAAHGTDLQWHPKEPEPQQPQDAEPDEQEHTFPVFVVNGSPMTKCPGCGKIVYCNEQDFPCPKCGATVKGFPQAGQQSASVASEPRPVEQPIDGHPVGKFSRIVFQRIDYYIPRFRELKEQGENTASWNWAAFLLPAYWLAYRKCYLWSIFACFFDLFSVIFMSPMYRQVLEAAPDSGMTYAQLAELVMKTEFSVTASLLVFGAMFLLLIRSLVFGVWGNYIYKKECLRRIRRLDESPKEVAPHLVFRLGGVNIFAPVLVYYALSIAQNFLLSIL